MKLVNPWAANGEKEPVGEIPVTINPANQLIITLNDNGSVSVTGPIMHKILCYGLLEGAKDVISRYTPAKVG